jgi:hypothetical protein
MTSRWHWISGLLLLAASTVSAQDSASHIQLDGQNAHDRAPADLAQQLMKQVGRPQPNGKEQERIKEIADKLLKQIGDDKRPLDNAEARQQFLDKNPQFKQMLSDIDRKDPTYLESLRNAKNGPRTPARPNQGEHLDEIVRNLQLDASRTNSGSVTLPNGGSAGGPDWHPKDFGSDRNTRPPELPKTNVSGNGKTPELPRGPSTEINQGQMRENDFLKRLGRSLPKSMDKSPAMQRLVDDLANKDFSKSASSRFWKEGKLPDVNWNRVGRNMDRTGHFLDRNLSGMGRTNLPNAPRLDGPDLPRGPQMAGMGGAPSGGDVLELGKAGSIIVTILALVIGGFVLWRFLLKPLSQVRLKPAENGVGDWPVNPWLIRTREELVKAFDYLTLLKCGLPARMWHHHEVAEHLGEEAQRPHADNLADVYEQARYSPPPESIPEPVMDRARQDLCLLAGEAAP